MFNSQAQNTVGKINLSPSDMSFIIGNKTFTMNSRGDIVSSSEGSYISNTNKSNIIVASYNDVSIDDNRDISVWKGDYFPSVFYFPIGKHLLLRDYCDNNIMLTALDELIKTRQVVEDLDAIEIIGACSPVGSDEYNLQLALSRCMALRSYLRWKHLQFAESFPIRFNIVGVDRLGYHILKNQQPVLPEKQIWNMLQYAAVRLKMKDGSYIVPGSDKHKKITYSYPTVKSEVSNVSKRDTVFIKCDTVYHVYTTATTTTDRPVDAPPKTQSTSVHIALKNNLLYDLALLPNFTVEWYMGKQWSLAIEGNWSWWTFDHPIQNRWYYRIQTLGIELRKWVKSPYPLHGHSLGIYSTIGNYDIRLFAEDEYTKGWLSYQSWSTGLSYAYSVPVAHRFNLEFGLAVGYMGGRYYGYDYCMIHKHWAQRIAYNRNYFGPTRAGVSLVWLLGTGNKNEKNSYLNQKQLNASVLMYTTK
jgi:outer membrane protein OmpA-like peptidoglycan-associated protein